MNIEDQPLEKPTIKPENASDKQEKVQSASQKLAISQPVHQKKATQQLQGSSEEEHSKKTKKKRRKHKKKVPVRDPEQLKQIRLQRLNHLREKHWNDRFSNETIPDLKFSKGNKAKLTSLRRTRSPIQTVYANANKDIFKNHKLPPVLTKYQRHSSKDVAIKKAQKSFKIRGALKNKKTVQKEEKAKRPQSQARQILIKQEQKQKQQTEENKKQNKLQDLLQSKKTVHQIQQFYYKIVSQAIQLLSAKKSKGLLAKKRKQIKSTIQKQIKQIGTQQYEVGRITKLIEERKKSLRQIEEAGETVNLQTLLHLQDVSVQIVEGIVRFKSKWQDIFGKLGDKRRIAFSFENANYLQTMSRQVKNLSKQGVSDPFLVVNTASLFKPTENANNQQTNQNKETWLKIRACQLLLIEQEIASWNI